MITHPPANGSWAPTSPCTPDCVPPAPGPRASRLLVVARLSALLTVLICAAAGVLLPARPRGSWLRGCHRAALRAVGVRLQASGDVRYADGGALVVANHMSWLDVVALGAVQPVRMLAKCEVRDWPVIGGIAARTGALFVDRAGLHALPATVAATAAALRDGAVIGVFPEGTTWCGGAAGEFRRAAFQAAVDAGAPVRPVAITFRLPDGTPAGEAAFLGEQTLLDSLLRVARLPAIACELTVLPPISAAAGDRRELARLAADAIAGVTGVAHGRPATAPVRQLPLAVIVEPAAAA
jgi:1-acyl-sn-glycerol-3-phosphate acyltransferase